MFLQNNDIIGLAMKSDMREEWHLKGVSDYEWFLSILLPLAIVLYEHFSYHQTDMS
jgi:hypothetical protein